MQKLPFWEATKVFVFDLLSRYLESLKWWLSTVRISTNALKSIVQRRGPQQAVVLTEVSYATIGVRETKTLDKSYNNILVFSTKSLAV